MARILVIEDNPEIALCMHDNLEIEGYDVEISGDGRAGLERVRSYDPDLIILDLVLPELDGYRVLRRLRDDSCDKPVMVVSGKDQEVDRVRTLRFGADDHLVKPFGVMELVARVDALLRRCQRAQAPAEATLQFGEIEVRVTARMVLRSGQKVDLAPKEYELLLALVRQPDVVISRIELLRRVWGYSDAVTSRTVDTHIASLRRIIESDPANPRHIHTVRKVGYRFSR
ncbi:MAG TPA: response regulator transcription factor [Thermoanaerobaculia bacterium]